MQIKMQSDKKLLIIIDGNNYIYRSYFAVQGLTDSSGKNIGAVFGFLKTILYILNKYLPSHVLITFDSFSKKRKNLYPEYKANRKGNIDGSLDDLYSQIDIVKNMIKILGVSSWCVEGFEADDIVVNVVDKAKRELINTLIFSSDKDFAQLVTMDNLINLARPGFKGGESILTWEGVKTKFGVYPNLISKYLALIGDSSDNVPGVRGFGPKTALKILNNIKNDDNILSHAKTVLSPQMYEKFLTNFSMYELSLRLIDLTVDHELQVPEIASFEFDRFAPGSREHIHNLGFASLERQI